MSNMEQLDALATRYSLEYVIERESLAFSIGTRPDPPLYHIRVRGYGSQFNEWVVNTKGPDLEKAAEMAVRLASNNIDPPRQNG